jgi:long-chain acyl-CoA synthetase
VTDVNARVSSTEAIIRFAIIDRDFSLEEGEITTTLKIKLNVIAAHYGNLLENLYA